DANAGSGTISGATIGGVAATGNLSATNLSNITFTGAIAGNVAATNVTTMQAAGVPVAPDGNTVFKITQAGVERRIVAIPVSGPLAGVLFSYYYDGTSGVNP